MKKTLKSQKTFREMFSESGKILSLGLVMGICIGLGVTFGYFIDSFFRIHPYGSGLGIIWGVAAAVVQAYNVIRESLPKK